MKKTLILSIAIAFGLVACGAPTTNESNFHGGGPQPRGGNHSQLEAQAEAEAAANIGDSVAIEAPKATTTTTAPTTTTTTVAVADSGDWVSVEAYGADMVETLDAVTGISEIMADAGDLVVNGTASYSEYGDLAGTAIESLDSHIDYFVGMEPPSAFAETHGYIMEGLYEMRNALVYIQEGAYTIDPALLDEGTRSLNNSTESFVKASDAMPTNF